jgi:hypothetical protein
MKYENMKICLFKKELVICQEQFGLSLWILGQLQLGVMQKIHVKIGEGGEGGLAYFLNGPLIRNFFSYESIIICC